ncbi:metal-dependent hydrolase [Rhodococcus aerolatus]
MTTTPERRTARPSPDTSADKVALHARNVSFDWDGLPVQWIPGEAFASHLLNVLHLLLPEGERFFVRVFSDALPLIRDPQLREDVIGFIGQEGMHASAHQGAQDHLAAAGLDADGSLSTYVDEIATLFHRLLGDRRLSGKAKEEWLVERLAIIAGIEHVTAFLGHWVLNSPGLDRAGADPRMLDLLRWHGSEEVEHRSVAHDLYSHVDGRYPRRLRTYFLGGPGLIWLWISGIKVLMAADPSVPAGVKPRWRDLRRSRRKGITPGYWDLAKFSVHYLKPSYHPSQVGSTEQAVAYLAQSPAALAADQPG